MDALQLLMNSLIFALHHRNEEIKHAEQLMIGIVAVISPLVVLFCHAASTG